VMGRSIVMLQCVWSTTQNPTSICLARVDECVGSIPGRNWDGATPRHSRRWFSRIGVADGSWTIAKCSTQVCGRIWLSLGWAPMMMSTHGDGSRVFVVPFTGATT
jgi:hypothetical protein